MTQRFDNKVALVTGAGAGIGAGTAELLASRGAKLILVGRRREPLERVAKAIRAAGGVAEVCPGDTSQAKDMQAAVEFALSKFGALHLAVNNAGISGETKLIADTSVEEWDQVVAINLSGIFYCMKFQISAMLKSGGGAIVNISSVFGDKGFPGRSPYSATKHGVRGLTRSAAAEYGEQGIRINEVAPGIFDTDMAENSPPEQVQAITAMTPLRRIGRVNEVAETISYLLSDEASYMTGARLTVDGGFLA